MLLTTQIAAGQMIDYVEVGDFFRLMQSDAPLDIFFYKSGREYARAEGVTEGYSESFHAGTFDQVKLRSAVAQTIQFASRYGNSVTYDRPPTGAVEIINVGGDFSQKSFAAGAASAQALAANPTRRYLLIQNTDAANAVFVRFDGAAVTAANGLKIPAGGSFVAEVFSPRGAVTAIAPAGAPSLIIIEG